jgi:hypothetical protein
MKQREITVKLLTGNDNFKTDTDIAAAFEELARRIRQKGLDSIGKVMDGNGNSVGTVDVELIET